MPDVVIDTLGEKQRKPHVHIINQFTTYNPSLPNEEGSVKRRKRTKSKSRDRHQPDGGDVLVTVKA